MNLIQIKCSDSFKENTEEVIPQVTYVKNKFSYLLNININNAYLSYLSIFQKPKTFAKNNKHKTFLYDIMEDKFVDFKGNEYKRFPVLEKSIIYLSGESTILSNITSDLYNSFFKPVTLVKKEKRKNNININDIENMENNLHDNELYVYASPTKFMYYYKLDNIFGGSFKYGKQLYEDKFEQFFEIKY